MQDVTQDVLLQEMPKTNLKLEILKIHFPECFDKEGRILINRLEETLRGGGA